MADSSSHNFEWLTRKQRIDPILDAVGWSVGARHSLNQSRRAAAFHMLIRFALAKAFRGELIPSEHALAEAKGREHESAEKLLSRVRQKGLVAHGA